MAFREGWTDAFEFRIGAPEMEAFARLSGDDNPLHSDGGYARRRGFLGPVVYGGLITAQLSRLLGTRIPGPGCIWRSFTLHFRAPLYVDEPARAFGTVIHANEDLGVFEMKLRVEAAGRCIAEGRAAVLLAKERVPAHA